MHKYKCTQQVSTYWYVCAREPTNVIAVGGRANSKLLRNRNRNITVDSKSSTNTYSYVYVCMHVRQNEIEKQMEQAKGSKFIERIQQSIAH